MTTTPANLALIPYADAKTGDLVPAPFRGHDDAYLVVGASAQYLILRPARSEAAMTYAAHDVRRQKSYSAQISLRYDIIDRAFPTAPRAPYVQPNRITEAIARARTGALDSLAEWTGNADCHTGYGNDDPTTIRLGFHANADRPSEIIPMNAALATFASVLPALDLIVASGVLGIYADNDRQKANEAAAKIARDAGVAIQNEIRKAAKAVVRYEQRLAALHAEFAAEVSVQAEAVRAKYAAEPWTSEGGALDPAVQAVVLARWDEIVKDATHDASGGFFTEGGLRFTADDVAAVRAELEG